MSQEEISLDACQPTNRRNVLERWRRKRITISCERLRRLLPMFPGRQDDMASILEMTVEYLQLVHEHLRKHQQFTTLPSLPASAELHQGPGEAPASVAQPIAGEEASENTRSTQIPFRKCEHSRSVQASPKAMEVLAVEPRLTPEGTSLLKAVSACLWIRTKSNWQLLRFALSGIDGGDFHEGDLKNDSPLPTLELSSKEGATSIGVIADGEPATLPLNISGAPGCPKPPEEPVALLCEMEESSPLLSSTSQRWLTRLSFTPGPSWQEDFLADDLKRSSPGGPNWSRAEPGPQKEMMLHAGAMLWKDEPEFKLEVEGRPSSGATGAQLQPELSWMSEQEMHLQELDPALTPGSQMLFENQPNAAWDSKNSLHYLAAALEDMDTGFLEMYGLLALDRESEP